VFLNVLGEPLFFGFDKLSHFKGSGYSFQAVGFDKSLPTGFPLLSLSLFKEFTKIQCMHCKFTYFCDMSKKTYENQSFEAIAEKMVIYKIRESWFQIARFYDKMAEEYGVSISMAFVLLALDEDEGTPVTKVAPRIGMEPNSLSRILKKMVEDEFIVKKETRKDKRKVLLLLTERGKEMREIALRAVFKLESSVIKSVSPSELESFFKVVSAIPDSIESVREGVKSNISRT
jgi:MarR family transcriptional regulator, organic hydroperoxide resistance regulator